MTLNCILVALSIDTLIPHFNYQIRQEKSFVVRVSAFQQDTGREQLLKISNNQRVEIRLWHRGRCNLSVVNPLIRIAKILADCNPERTAVQAPTSDDTIPPHRISDQQGDTQFFPAALLQAFPACPFHAPCHAQRQPICGTRECATGLRQPGAKIYRGSRHRKGTRARQAWDLRWKEQQHPPAMVK